MQYFRNSQNNRLTSSLTQKEVSFAAEPDTASDSSFENPVSQLKDKTLTNLPSTVASHLSSVRYDSNDEKEILKQQQQPQLCVSFYSCGYCPNGSSCCYAHSLKTICQIKNERKATLNTQLLLQFPELIGVGIPRRIRSFLQ